jgi:hypothetical protein
MSNQDPTLQILKAKQAKYPFIGYLKLEFPFTNMQEFHGFREDDGVAMGGRVGDYYIFGFATQAMYDEIETVRVGAGLMLLVRGFPPEKFDYMQSIREYIEGGGY